MFTRIVLSVVVVGAVAFSVPTGSASQEASAQQRTQYVGGSPEEESGYDGYDGRPAPAVEDEQLSEEGSEGGYDGNPNGDQDQPAAVGFAPTDRYGFRPQPAGPTYFLGVTVNHRRSGAEVRNVYFGTPAQRLGLESGDVITSINGMRVNKSNSLYSVLQNAGNMSQNGVVLLGLSDVRTGNVLYRRVRLGVR